MPKHTHYTLTKIQKVKKYNLKQWITPKNDNVIFNSVVLNLHAVHTMMFRVTMAVKLYINA